MALGTPEPEASVSESDYAVLSRYLETYRKDVSFMKIPTVAATPIVLAALASSLPAQSGLGCRPAVKSWTPACVTATYVRHALPAFDAAVLEGPDKPLKASLPQARQPHYRVLE